MEESPTVLGRFAVNLPRSNPGASGRHELTDLKVAIEVEGDFVAAHVDGDNRLVLPTDTMKNTVYALARKHGIWASTWQRC